MSALAALEATARIAPALREAARAELARRRAHRPPAPVPLLDYCRRVTPTWDWEAAHLRLFAAHLERLRRREIGRLAVELPVRHGKLLADETPMLTARGWTTHGDLRVGDYVLHPSGRWVAVRAISAPAPADVRVETTDGAVFYCHEAHEWTLLHRPNRRIVTVETRDLIRTPVTKKPRRLQSGGKWMFGLPERRAAEAAPGAPSLPVAPYTLGAWLGDGTSSKAWITHAASDVAVVERVERDGYEKVKQYVHAKTGVVSSVFQARTRGGKGSPLHQALKAAGVLNNKHIPDAYFTASVADRLQLLAGLIDTDGSVGADGRVRIVTAMPRLATDIAAFVRTFGWRVCVSEADPAMSSSGVFGKKLTYYIGFQPGCDIPTVLTRKRIARLVRGKAPAIRSVRIDPQGKIGRCIEVDAEDGLYCAGRHLTPTHNSETGTVRFPAQWITEAPQTRVLIGSHSALLAQKFSRQARRLVRSAGVGISDEKDTAAEWETTAGGGLRAVGAGAGSAGMGADLVVIDDPFGSRGDAESEAGREAVWDWVTNDMLSRLEPNGVAVVTHSRWHSDDVIGRIRSGQLGDGWTILTLPAEAYDDGTPDPLGRAPGEALWPARWPREALQQRRAELGEYAYASLYQQRPQPRSGGMFPWAKWVELDAVPVIPGRLVRYWDLAGTEPRGASHDPDYTAGALAGVMSDQRIAVLDVARFRVASAERLARMVQIAQADRAKYGGRVSWWIERPTGMTGAEQQQALARALMHTGLAVHFESPTGDKTLRAEPLSAAQGAGNVCLAPDGPTPWRDAFRTEAADFPRGKHDDQVDAAVGAFAKLTLAPVSGAISGTFSR